jgi:putative OPT family oligopeptide transporter
MQDSPTPPPSRRELTIPAILLGIAIAIVFGAANAYLGLRAGMTVSASIPAAVISMAIFSAFRRRNALLENNMVQTIGSSGESVAAGAIFTLPALLLWGYAPNVMQFTILAIVGGLLGILMMIPLRRRLIVEEHDTLPFPEGTACAQVLKAGQAAGAQARAVFQGLGLGALFRVLGGGVGLFPESIAANLRYARSATLGMDALASLLGVGYIIGLRVSALVFAGGVLGWLVFMPLITMLGDAYPGIVAPATEPIAKLGPDQLWSAYLRYIGVGAVAFGGLLSLVKSIPLLWQSVHGMWRTRHAGAATPLEYRDLGAGVVLFGTLGLIVLIWALPDSIVPLGLPVAILVAVFGFFFVAVTSRIVGIIGNYSCPVSGMTIATLIVCSLILLALGYTPEEGKVAALVMGAIVCIAISNAGDTSQDLKTGYLVGATPSRQQIGEMIGVAGSALFVALTIFVLQEAYGIGSEQVPAPQAQVMSVVIPGVLTGQLPWTLIFVGAATALVVELLGIASLPFAVGLYLPISTTTPIMLGGLLHWLMVERRSRAANPLGEASNGTLLASGLIAGDALVGILLALVVYAGRSVPLSKPPVFDSRLVTLLTFSLLLVALAWVDRRHNAKDRSQETGDRRRETGVRSGESGEK